MSLRFPHRSADGHAGTSAAQGSPRSHPGAPELADSPVTYPDRACCCPARPLVKVILPGTDTRPPVDLWLCGHHWRASREALAGTGAVAYDLATEETEPSAGRQGVVV